MTVFSEIMGDWSGVASANMDCSAQNASAEQLAALHARSAAHCRPVGPDYSMLMNAWAPRRPLLEPEITARTGTPWMDLA